MGFDPISLMIGGLVMGAAGSATSAYGAYESGQASKAAADYQAQVYKNNAKIAQQNANWEVQSGEEQATVQGLKTGQEVGAMKAAQAASGIDVNTGSAVAVRAGQSSAGMLDALTIRSNAARKAYGYQVQATSDIAEAGLLRQEGAQAATAGDIGAVGSLLGGVGSAVGGIGKIDAEAGGSGFV